MKYGPEIVDKIVELIRHGNSHKDAAMLAGTTEKSYYEWIKTHSEFREKIKKSELAFKDELIGRMFSFTKSPDRKISFYSTGWLLERKYRDEFSVRQELTGGNGQPFQVNITAGFLSTRQNPQKLKEIKEEKPDLLEGPKALKT